MATNVILATQTVETQDRLSQLLAETEEITVIQTVDSGEALHDALERNPDVDVVLIDSALKSGGTTVARSISAAYPLVGIALLVEETTPEEYAAAMDAGARSVLSRSSSLNEIVSRLEALSEWALSARQHLSTDLAVGRAGTIIAVYGAKGGVGTSVVSLLLAQALRERHSVAIADFDLQNGDIDAYAGVSTQRSLVDLVDLTQEMSGRVLVETSYDISNGLRLLSAPTMGEAGEQMTPEAARAIVNSLRYQFDFAVLDLGSHLDEAKAVILELVDQALLVTTPDLPALRGARRTLSMWDRLMVRPANRVHLVLNRRSNKSEVQQSLAQRVVEVPVAFTVEDGGPTFESAMNTATITQVKTPAHNSIQRALVGDMEKQAGKTLSETPPEADPSAPATPAPNGASPGTRQRQRRKSKSGADRGQAAIELPVALMFILLTLVICVQGIFYGVGFLMADNAAQQAARALQAGKTSTQVHTAAKDELSSWWSDRAQVAVRSSSVSVDINIPTVIPGLNFTSSASANAWKEQQ